MADWIVAAMPTNKAAIHRKPKAGLVAAAGSELGMPGGKRDYEDILKGLTAGMLTGEQLQVIGII